MTRIEVKTKLLNYLRENNLTDANVYLPDLCIQLRMMYNGSADGWLEPDIEGVRKLLQQILETWEPSIRSEQAGVDDAVYALIVATLKETETR